MKHIKKYETKYNEFFKYKINNYVLLEGDDWLVFPIVKIISKNSNKFKFDEHEEENLNIDYYVETFLKENSNRLDRFWIDEDDIKRKATNEEIEDYEMKKSAIQYNL